MSHKPTPDATSGDVRVTRDRGLDVQVDASTTSGRSSVR
jgi:hypothetical protein